MDPWGASLDPRWDRLLVDGYTVNCCLGRDILPCCIAGCNSRHILGWCAVLVYNALW